MPFVYSTLSADNKFSRFRPRDPNGGANVTTKSVIVKGGANVAQQKPLLIDSSGSPLHTLPAMRTEVTDAELEFLEAHPRFISFVVKGYMKVDKKQTAIKAASDLQGQDLAAPKTPSDYGGKVKTKGKKVSVELNEIPAENE